MPKTCACHGCTNRSSRLSNVSFHRFPPSDPDLLLKWKISIWREDFQPTANHSVCSDHFLSKDYQHGLHPRDGPKGTCYKLLAKAVPTVITETEPIRRPRKPKNHPKPILLIKAQCRDNNNADEKVAFQPPEVFNRTDTDGSAASLCIQQLKSEVTAQSLRVHSPNPESRNLVTDELRVTALSGVVTQEAKNSDKHRTFRTPEVFDGNDGSADLCIQQIKSEVTAQSLRVHSPNPESRNLVTDELRVTALSGVVTQEAKNSDKHRTFRTPEVFNGNDGSADLCIQQIKSEVTAQSLRVHSPNPESRNLVTDELRVTALSGVVTQEPKNSDKHRTFRPQEVFNRNDGSAAYLQQQKSEVTAQSLRLYPSNPESRNLVTDELCVTGHSGVVTQEPNNGDKCRSKVAVHKVMIGRASVENMERELKETKFRLRESRKEVETLKLKLKRRDDDLSKILKELEEQQMISRQVIINHSACSGHVLREECLQGVNLTEYEKELLADAREAHQQQEQKSRRKQTLPMKRQCPNDEGVDSAALQPLKKVNGSDDKCTASPQVQRQESEVTEEKPQVHVHTHVTNTEAQKPCLGEQRLNELHVHVHLKSSTKNRK
ncbi:uncharacterized protein [Asterias amurensis]|uniref:uncharacterized protein n=1 Tax=Asterias amurensis TaxID=7602 RepID=UPI003AB6271D